MIALSFNSILWYNDFQKRKELLREFHMKMEYIHEFVVLSNVGYHFEAAEQLFISQSSLSKHMRSLEKDLGVKLFERDFSTKRSYLNENGKIFLDYALQMDEAYQNCTNFFAVSKNNASNTFTIGLNYNLYDLINDFQESHPQYKTRLIESQPSHELYKMMRKGTCDAAVMVTKTFKPDFDYHLEKYTRLEFLLPEKHPLAHKKSLTLAEIANQPFIIPNLLSEESKNFYGYCQHFNVFPNVQVSGINSFIMLEYVRRNLGISFCFNQSYTLNDLKGISVVPFADSQELGVYLTIPKRSHPLASITELVNYVKSRN